MNSVRDFIYVSYEEELSRVISSGIEFKEFIQALSVRPRNILVLAGHFVGEHDFITNCEYCVNEDIDAFLEEDVYNYGDFAWIDFESPDSLKLLEPIEVAELFYLAKKWQPITGTFFEKLNNRFVYTAHDDGWINYTYYNQSTDFDDVFGNAIISKVHQIYSAELPKMDAEVLQKLHEISKEGIVVDVLRFCIDEDDYVVIPIYKLGKCSDMDEVYRLVREVDVIVDFELRYKYKWEVTEL